MEDSRGQISLELLLLIGLILALTLSMIQFIGPSIEQDQVMSAAKIGVINASNDIAYSTNNVINFNNMTFNNGNITITIYSKKALSPTDKGNMTNQTLDSIAQALNTNSNGSTVKGRYNYSVIINNVI